MAEAELTLKYRERHVAVLHLLSLAAVPVCTLFAFLCSIQVWGLENLQAANASLFLFSLLLLLCGVILAVLITSDKTIFLSRDGISLPFVLCPALGLRSQQSWSNLSSVTLKNGGTNGILLLKFQNGRTTGIKLDLLSEAEIENLIVCLDVWTGGSDSFPALLEARMRIENKDGRLRSGNFTELWEEELARRFGPTNFVPLEAGQIVRGLKIERQLAFGGLSAIYQVSNGSKNESFILKEAVVPQDADQSMKQAAEDMLDKEAKILASLSHPKIARVLDHFLEAGRHYILMELIEGEDLRRLVLEHGAQPEADVLDWALQLAEVLVYLHSQNPPVIHRDLSPDNLMLRESGEICLIDFGFRCSQSFCRHRHRHLNRQAGIYSPGTT